MNTPEKRWLPLFSVGGTRGAFAAWRYLIPDRPVSVFSGQIAALIATAAAGLARWAITPLLGADVSFITAAPAVLVATLFGGRLAGMTALVAGSALEFQFSRATYGGSYSDALSRFAVWLFSAGFIMFVALELRAAMSALNRRERDLLAATHQLEFLNHELEHRGRNALAVVQAIAVETARSASSVEAYQEQLSGRLSALSASYATLTGRSEESTDLSTLANAVFAPFSRRIKIAGGPDCAVRRDASVPLTLALHELATNASKYGALSTTTGEVVVGWSLDTSGRVDLRWTERGGPMPNAVVTEGFGSQLLRRVFEGTDGAFRAIRKPEGMSFQILLPSAPEEKVRSNVSMSTVQSRRGMGVAEVVAGRGKDGRRS